MKIDYTKVGSYHSDRWLAEKEKQELNKGKIDFWRSSDGSTMQVKRGRLYLDGKEVYQKNGWGLTEGSILYYTKRKGKYRDKDYRESFIKYAKDFMRTFKIKKD